MKKRYYVGHTKVGGMHLVHTADPNEKEWGALFFALTGPFRTKAGAMTMIAGGVNNPHTTTVSDCERIK